MSGALSRVQGISGFSRRRHRGSDSSKTIYAALLASILFLAGSGTVSADTVSLCQYWHGDAKAICKPAFDKSKAKRGYSDHRIGSGCYMEVSGGFPYWRDRSINSIDPDSLDDSQRERLAKWKEMWGDSCACSVFIKCRYLAVIRAGYVAALTPRVTHHKCSATADSLRAMEYNAGSMTPSC